MDPNTSIGRLCLGENDRISLNDKIMSEGNWEGPKYQDTTDSGRKKEVKAFTFHRMETEEVSERYITSCIVEGLDAYDGITDLEYEKNMISNEFSVKLRLTYELKKNGERVVSRDVLIILKGELYFVIINDDSDDEIDALLASIDVDDLPPLKITNMPPFVYKMGKIFVLLDKLKLDGELEVEEEAVGEEFIKRREKVKPLKHKITMLGHSKPKHMGRLLDVLYQNLFALGYTYKRDNIKSFLLLDIPIKGTTSTFDGIVHQKFYVANVRNAYTESYSDDDEEYCLKRDDMGKPIYGPSRAKYLSCDDPMDRALAL
ncbi:hypothetical protein Tco_0539648 [Tanacetum coccineum]